MDVSCFPVKCTLLYDTHTPDLWVYTGLTWQLQGKVWTMDSIPFTQRIIFTRFVFNPSERERERENVRMEQREYESTIPGREHVLR